MPQHSRGGQQKVVTGPLQQPHGHLLDVKVFCNMTGHVSVQPDLAWLRHMATYAAGKQAEHTGGIWRLLLVWRHGWHWESAVCTHQLGAAEQPTAGTCMSPGMNSVGHLHKPGRFRRLR